MKRSIGAIAAVSLLGTSSCTAILKEVRYPGGYPGYLLDKRTFDASGSKQLMLLRATLILGLAAEMSRVTVHGEDADSFAKHLQNATIEINHAAADIYPIGGRFPCTTLNAAIKGEEECNGFYENFDANLPLIEGRLVRVMLAVLPTDHARKFLDDASKGNLLGAALNGFRAVMKAAGGLHVGFARYRTGLETVAGAMGDKCSSTAKLPILPPPVEPGKAPGAPKKATTFTPGPFMTVIEAAECLGLSQDKLFQKNPEGQRAWLTVEIQPAAFFMLMRGVASACVALPYGGSATQVNESRGLRTKICGELRFTPTARPISVPQQDAPTPSPTPSSTPTPSPTPTSSEEEE